MRFDIDEIRRGPLQVPRGQELKPFQVKAVRKMLRFMPQTLNACEPGLGKTIQAIVLANTLEVKRTLIVCPAIMRLTWEREVRKWTTCRKLTVGTIITARDVLETKGARVVIVSYNHLIDDFVRRHLIKEEITLLIGDEAHNLKNFRAQRTEAFFDDLWPRANYRVLMTGTPFISSVTDAYTLFSACDPQSFPSFSSFAARYARKRITPFAIEYYGIKNHEQLRSIIRKKFYVRYTKAQVAKELPPKIWTEITLPRIYRAAKRKTVKVEAELLNIINELEGGKKKELKVPKHIAEYRKDQGLAIVPAVVDYANQLLDQGLKCVLFAHHKEVIKLYVAKLKKWRPYVITGETPAGARQRQIEQFQDGDGQLFILNTHAGGVGVTLTEASEAIVAEPDWSPAILSQAVDRLHRIGQTRPVTAHYFTIEQSLYSKILRAVVHRAEHFNAVVD